MESYYVINDCDVVEAYLRQFQLRGKKVCINQQSPQRGGVVPDPV